MRLVLIRHAIAEEGGSRGDAERGLTAEGRKKALDVCRALKGMDLGVQRVFTSPLVRARETAAIVADELGLKSVEETKALLPEARPEALAPVLKALKGIECVAVVGHEPHLSRLAAWCMGGGKVEVRKSGVVVLEGAGLPAAGAGMLVGLFAPRHLRPLV